MLIDLVNVQQTSQSKVLLIQGEPAVNKVTGALLQGATAPRVAILVNSASEMIMELLRQDGYDASLLATSDQAVLEAVLAKQPDILMLDCAVLEVLMQDIRNRMDEHIKMSQENAARLIELERQTDQGEEKIADLVQRNTELETALVRAQGMIQSISEIARRTLGLTAAAKHPGAASARGNLQREGEGQ